MEHTSKLIKGSLSSSLEGKKITLCVTGSVAAVECVALSRQLMRHGAEIYTVMSEMGTKIVHPYLLEWATGNPVVTQLTGQIEHITLAGKHKTKVTRILRKHTKYTADGRQVIAVEVKRKGKKPVVATFGRKPIERKLNVEIQDEISKIYTKRNE